MHFKTLRWVLLFVIYSVLSGLENTRSTNMVEDNYGNVVKTLKYNGDRQKDFRLYIDDE